MMVYLDSCIVIYLVEHHPKHAATIRDAIIEQSNIILCISPLVTLEVFVKPMRNQNTSLIQKFHKYLNSQSMLEMPQEIFNRALHLRVKHGLKTPDALHLATAIHHNCAEFWTNDDHLVSVFPELATNILKKRVT